MFSDLFSVVNTRFVSMRRAVYQGNAQAIADEGTALLERLAPLVDAAKAQAEKERKEAEERKAAEEAAKAEADKAKAAT